MTCLRVWQKPGFRIYEHAHEEKSHEITSFEYIRDSLELSYISNITDQVRLNVHIFYLENMTSPSKLVTQNHHIQCYILIIFCCYMHAERKLLLKKKTLKEQNWYIYKTRIINS